MDRIIDVREPLKFKLGHVKGAINIPLSKLNAGAEKLQNVPKDTEVIFYSLSSSRTNIAINILKDLGYTNLVNGISKSHVKDQYL